MTAQCSCVVDKGACNLASHNEIPHANERHHMTRASALSQVSSPRAIGHNASQDHGDVRNRMTFNSGRLACGSALPNALPTKHASQDHQTLIRRVTVACGELRVCLESDGRRLTNPCCRATPNRLFSLGRSHVLPPFYGVSNACPHTLNSHVTH